MLTRIPSLYIAPSPKGGRGVFTAQPIAAGNLLEICPVIVLPPEDLPRVHATRLHDYYFLWGNDGATAIALGFGSLYNHSSQPNADYEMHLADESIHIRSIADIPAGAEITMHYTDGGRKQTELWFEER